MKTFELTFLHNNPDSFSESKLASILKQATLLGGFDKIDTAKAGITTTVRLARDLKHLSNPPEGCNLTVDTHGNASFVFRDSSMDERHTPCGNVKKEAFPVVWGKAKDLASAQKLKHEITFLVKSFMRKDCVHRLVASILKRYPESKVLIVDDSGKNWDFSVSGHNVETLHIDFDSGISKGRNAGVQAITTPWLVLLDDDFLFSDETNIAALHSIASENDLDILAGIVKEGKRVTPYYANLTLENGTLEVAPVSWDVQSERGFKRADLVINFFIAKTESLKKNPWDDELKLCEHTAFFTDHLGKLKVGFTDKCAIQHDRQRPPDYNVFRSRNLSFLAKWMRKKGVEKIYDHSRCWVWFDEFGQIKHAKQVTESNSPSKLNANVAIRNLTALHNIFIDNNAEYWVSCGTLLGFYRNNGFIPGDTDTDVCLAIESLSSKLIEDIKSAGFSIGRSFGTLDDGFELSVHKNNVKTDIFCFYRQADSGYFSAYAQWDEQGSKKYDYVFSPFGIKQADYCGHTFNVPDDIEKYLSEQYGPNFMTPVMPREWCYWASPANVKDANRFVTWDETKKDMMRLVSGNVSESIPTSQKRILAYGTYDLLHVSHVRFLEKCKAMGGKLFVGVSTDRFNEECKGKKATIPFEQRIEMVKSLRCVDGVFPEDCWEQKASDIKRLSVDVFVIGDDWKGKFDYLNELCEVVYSERQKETSSTLIRKAMKTKLAKTP